MLGSEQVAMGAGTLKPQTAKAIGRRWARAAKRAKRTQRATSPAQLAALGITIER